MANKLPCKVTEQIKAYFDKRTEVGLEKYGVTMDREDLTNVEWCTHAIDELADGIQYLWKLRAKLQDKPKSQKPKYVPYKADPKVNDYVWYREPSTMHFVEALVCGYVEDPEDGHLVIIQTAYDWMGVPLGTLYHKETVDGQNQTTQPNTSTQRNSTGKSPSSVTYNYLRDLLRKHNGDISKVKRELENKGYIVF